MNVEIKKSDIHGRGLFAVETVPADTTQMVYGSFSKKPMANGFEHVCGLWFKPYKPFFYVNHSSNPNCVVLDFENGTTTISTLMAVPKGEVLTIDYGCPKEQLPWSQ